MGDRVTRVDVENLRRAVATSGHVATILAESHAAHDTLMRKVVDKVNVEYTAGSRVEDGEPITTFLLQVLRELLNV
jgi:hypothetical protein